MFSFIWLAAIAGTIVSFCKLKEHSIVETVCFVLMGLSVIVAFGPLLRKRLEALRTFLYESRAAKLDFHTPILPIAKTNDRVRLECLCRSLARLCGPR